MPAPYDIVQSVQANGGAFNTTAAQTATATWGSTTLAGNLLCAVAMTDGWDALGVPSPTDWATSAPAGWTWGGISVQGGQAVAVFYILSSAPRSGAEVFDLGWTFINGSDFSLTLIEVDAAGATFDTAVWEGFTTTGGFSSGQALGVNSQPAGVFVGGVTVNGTSHDPAIQIGAAPLSGTNELGAFHLDDVAAIHQGSIRAVVGTCMDADSMQVTGDVTLYGDGGGTNGALGFLWIYPSAGDPAGGGSGGSGSGGSGSGSGGSGGPDVPTVDIVVDGDSIQVICVGEVTVAMIVDAINADPDASALVVASLPEGDGSDLAVNLAETPLAGGADSGTFTPTDDTYYETVSATGSLIASEADGTPLDPDTDYYIRVVPYDFDGDGEASA